MGPAATSRPGRQAAEGMDGPERSAHSVPVPISRPFGFTRLRSGPASRGWGSVRLSGPNGPGGTERGVSMQSLVRSVKRFLQKEDGPTAVEYAVMLALILVVCITAIKLIGTNANAVFSNVALNTAVSAS